MESFEDRLRGLAEEMRSWASREVEPAIRDPVDRIETAAGMIAKAWSGSSFGYHSRVYYEGLAPPPPGAHFSPEWGFLGTFQGTTGNWREYPYDEVLEYIRRQAGNPHLTEAQTVSEGARKAFDAARSEVISIIIAFLSDRSDEYIVALKSEAEKIAALTKNQAIRAQLPSGGTFMSRDTTALMQGALFRMGFSVN